jgi:hypothetical protein
MKAIVCTVVILLTIQLTALAQVARPTTATTIQKNNVLQVSALADLVVSIKSIVPNGNNYTIKFIIRNQGGGTVDLRQVFVQGNVYASNGNLVTAGGSVQLLNYGSLNKMQEVEAQLLFTSQVALLNTESFVYKLKADDKNTVSEADENNNIAEFTFRGNAAPVASTMANLGNQDRARAFVPDLVIRITSIVQNPNVPGGYIANYTINNVGTGACNLKEYTVQGSIREASSTNFAPCGGESLMYDGIVLEPGKEFKFSRGISANLAKNTSYRFRLELNNQRPSTNNIEYNYTNNSTEASFTTSN